MKIYEAVCTTVLINKIHNSTLLREGFNVLSGAAVLGGVSLATTLILGDLLVLRDDV